jgi:hypothetical protein
MSRITYDDYEFEQEQQKTLKKYQSLEKPILRPAAQEFYEKNKDRLRIIKGNKDIYNTITVNSTIPVSRNE